MFILLILVSSIVVTLFRWKKLTFKFNTIHVLIVSFVWLIIYLLNSNFSILTGNGFDDYHYIGLQKILINNIKISNKYTEHAANIIEGWVYVNAAISKIFNLDAVSYSRISYSIVNIFITTSITESVSSLFVKKNKKYTSYSLLLLILFPLFSYEFWFGSISRLIYRPFYGSSLSSVATNLYILYMVKTFLEKSTKFKIYIILTWISILLFIHINNILLIFGFSAFYLLSKWNRWLPYTITILFWILGNIFIGKLFVNFSSKSTHEYYNIMYDVTRYSVVITYMIAIIIYINKSVKSKLDNFVVLFIPFIILFIFFTNTKIILFNIIYGFGLQRMISQLLVILYFYTSMKILAIDDSNLQKLMSISILLICVIFFKETSIYSGIIQKKENIFLRTDKDSINIDNLIGKNKNVLTQSWLNIQTNTKIDFSSYYSYIGTNSCSYNLFSNLKSSTNSNAYYYNNDITNKEN